MCGFGGIARIGSDVDLTLLERAGGRCSIAAGPGRDVRLPSTPMSVRLAAPGWRFSTSVRRAISRCERPMRQCASPTTARSTTSPAARRAAGEGYQFRSQSDTETVLYAYQAYGTDAFARLNGMFALALHGPAPRAAGPGARPHGDQAALLPLGRQPIALRVRLRALLRHGGISVSPDADAVELYLAFGHAVAVLADPGRPASAR